MIKNPEQPITKYDVTTSDIVVKRLMYLKDMLGYTWREIALESEFEGIPAGTLCTISQTGIVPRKYWHQLNMRAELETKRVAISKTNMVSASTTIMQNIAPEKVSELIDLLLRKQNE